MTTALTYWRTLRHLRASQVIDRIAFRLRRPRPKQRPAPPLRPRTGQWLVPARRDPSLGDATCFTFLDETHDLEQIGWDSPAVAKLWRYNLHYFDDLNARDAPQRSTAHAELLERWVAENPPTIGSGWEPYPVSLRIVNWIKWALGGGALPSPAVHSLAVQSRWLAMRLETHLLGNHLFANAKALLFAGLYFDGPEGEQWRRLGAAILVRELAEQVLADGGQFERSPMYHALALEDVLDLLNVMRAFGSPPGPLRDAIEQRVPAMLRWLLALTHPDGSLSLFNDSAAGVAPSNSELTRYAGALGFAAPVSARENVLHLRDSGYLRVERGRVVALLDVAPVGPDYLPGHAHADTLSFELSLDGRRVIVNGGTSCYGSGPRRQYERSTAAHSTVEVEAQDSSEVWAGFRVGRRARPSAPRIDTHNAQSRIECSHDGYVHLPGRPRHHRVWRFLEDSLDVTDRIDNPALHAIARFHLAPDLTLVSVEARRWAVTRDNRTIGHVEVRIGRGRIEPSTHAPRFGVVVPSHCLAVVLDAGEAAAYWTWHA